MIIDGLNASLYAASPQASITATDVTALAMRMRSAVSAPEPEILGPLYPSPS